MADMGLTLTCPDFVQGGSISAIHTRDATDTSPALQWSHTPPETGSFVLLMEDLNASDGAVTDWVLFDIHGSAAGLAAQETSIDVAGINDLHPEGYTVRCPPPRVSEHRYMLRMYAVSMASLC